MADSKLVSYHNVERFQYRAVRKACCPILQKGGISSDEKEEKMHKDVFTNLFYAIAVSDILIYQQLYPYAWHGNRI